MDAGTKALRALRVLGDRGSIGVTELATSTSSAHRVLAALRAEGFAVQRPGTRRYVLGPSADELGPGAAVDVVRASRPHLVQLADRSGETANLVTLAGDRMHFLDGVEGRGDVRVAPRIGDSLHAATTAGGKALLATRADSEVAALLGESWPGRTSHAIRDIAGLLGDLGVARRLGHAENRDESADGVFAVGAAAVVSGSVPVALTISAPTSRATDDNVAEWALLVRRAARGLGQDFTRA